MKAGKKGRIYTPEQLLAISARQSASLTQRGTASAVVQDFQTHQRLQESLLMLKLMAQGEADIQAERTTPQDRVFADIRARLTTAAGG